MVNPGMEQQANGPPLPFPGQQAGGGRANGHHVSSSTSTAVATVTNGGGERRMVGVGGVGLESQIYWHSGSIVLSKCNVGKAREGA